MSPHLPRLIDEFARAWWRYVAAEVAPHLPPRRPFPPSATLSREEAAVLVYKITPAAPGAADVASHEIAVTVNGVPADSPATVLPGGSFELQLADNDAVTLVQVDIDDAGNRSPASEPYGFTATDTIAPPQPGQPAVELLREE